VIRGAEVYHAKDNDPTAAGSGSNRGLTLQGNGSTGAGRATATERIIFVNGLKLRGVMKDGWVIDLGGDRNVSVYLTKVDGGVPGEVEWVGSRDGNHVDFGQAWNGPLKLYLDQAYVDGLTYQGLFLQQGMYGTEKGLYEVHLDRTHLGGTSTSAYMAWDSHGSKTFIGKNVPGSVSVFSERFPDGNDGQVFWDSDDGSQGRGDAWADVVYARRSRADVLG